MIAKNKLNLSDVTRASVSIINPFVCLVILMLTSCGGSEVIKGTESNLIKETVTAGNKDVVYPDAPPSVPDGKLVWQKQNCAVCHGIDGKAQSGKCSVNLSDKFYMIKQKPVDQYRFLVYGMPGISHPTVDKTITRREAWNLVFYVRSLGRPPLSVKEVDEVTPVFGSNCAVCHGTKGYGDGPLGRNFEPMPANFQNFSRFYDRTDFQLWDHIANGIKWEGMPNFLGKEDKAKNIKFDQAYIWKLVDYVRHFHESTQSTVSTGT